MDESTYIFLKGERRRNPRSNPHTRIEQGGRYRGGIVGRKSRKGFGYGIGQAVQHICQGIEPFRKAVLGVAKGILSKG